MYTYIEHIKYGKHGSLFYNDFGYLKLSMEGQKTLRFIKNTVFQTKRKVLCIWKDMRGRKWQVLHFGWTIPLNATSVWLLAQPMVWLQGENYL